MSCHIISYIISYHIYHIISYHIIYHITSHHISHHITSHHIIYHIISYHINNISGGGGGGWWWWWGWWGWWWGSCHDYRGAIIHSILINIHYISGLFHQHGPLARHVKLLVAQAPGMPGTFSPQPGVSDPDMHHGTCTTHVPWCIPGSLTSRFLWSRWRGKRSRHSRRMHNPQFYVSGKRAIGTIPRASEVTLQVVSRTWSRPVNADRYGTLSKFCIWLAIDYFGYSKMFHCEVIVTITDFIGPILHPGDVHYSDFICVLWYLRSVEIQPCDSTAPQHRSLVDSTHKGQAINKCIHVMTAFAGFFLPICQPFFTLYC